MASTSTSGAGDEKRDPFFMSEHPHEKIKASSVTTNHYNVFINHRGPDVRTTLAKHLYDSLYQAGIAAYLDSEETELGDYFPSAVKNAISSARVHIAILSPRYAESAWCLAELSWMFQTSARIIPLFYHVQPSDFRYIKNGVAEAFSRHEEKGRYPQHDIQQWKQCLQNVSWIKGYELNGLNNLKKLCDEVVFAVRKEKQKGKISASFKVGLDELLKDFHGHCQRNGQMRDNIIGIYGIGGSGKTTLAKYLFNRKKSEFDRSTILYDVRHVKDDLTSLQNKLLMDLLGIEDKIDSIEDGISFVKVKLQTRGLSKFLLVLDDVDNHRQLDALLPRDALNCNSLVLVTTRDERLLIMAGVRVRYKMKEMNREQSRELFCWHAFHRQSCTSGFENLIDSFVELCEGLPLALKVMGAHVSDNDISNWHLQLADVKASRLDSGIKHMLKISYDALEKDQKQIFMDIACFFIGKDASRAVSIWKASGWRAKRALQTLIDKCLVEVEVILVGFYEHLRLFRMHDHLRDLGTEMADNQNDPYRLWRPKELIGMRKIMGLQNILAWPGEISFRCSSHIEDLGLDMTYFLESSKTSTDLKWLELKYTALKNSLLMDIPEWIRPQNLHTLVVEGGPLRLWPQDDQTPRKLKELHYCFRRPFFPKDARLGYLKELFSSLRGLEHLEYLHLEFGPWSICNIDWNCLITSIRELVSLKTLELFHFNIHGEITLSNMGKTCLEAITLYCLFNTTKLSIGGQQCDTLKSLKLYFMTDIIEVDLTAVTALESLELLGCTKLRRVLVNDLLNLQMFRIRLCRTVEELPNFGRDSCLKRMYISRCQNLQSILAIERLRGLKRVWIVDCPKLYNIKAIEQLQGLKRIWIAKCPELKDTIRVKELKELKRIFIADCPKLQNIKGIGFLIKLERIMVAACPKMQNITGFEKLQGLKKIIISDSPIVSCVKHLQTLPRKLTIVMGRPAMSDLNAAQIGHALSMVDGFCEIGCEQQVEDSIDLLHETQHSLSTFIFCAMLEGCPDICMATYYKGYKGNADLCRHCGKWIYICVFNEEMRSEYESWKPSSCDTMKAFLMAVKKGEEGKALAILQSLFAELCDGKYYEDAGDDDCHGVNDDQEEAKDTGYNEYHKYEDSHNYDDYVDYDGYADYDDEDEEYGGSDD